MVAKAHEFISLYKEAGIDKERVLIKVRKRALPCIHC